MGHAFQIPRNARLPVLEGFAEDQDGAPLPIPATASVVFRGRASGVDTALVNAVATVSNASLGGLGYHWATGDTATVGYFQGQFRITYLSGQEQRVPQSGYIPYRVWDDV